MESENENISKEESKKFFEEVGNIYKNEFKNSISCFIIHFLVFRYQK